MLTAALLLISSFTALSSNINLERISENVHILSGKGYGTNIGLISLEDGVVLIDPMAGKNHLTELDTVIRSIYGTTNTLILNTHQHSDHTGGNDYFVKQGATLVEGKFDLNGITRIKVNSHSPEDYVYYHEKSNIIFVGDVFDASWHPTFYSGGIEGFDHAINTILNLGDDQSLIIPGHGSPAYKPALHVFRENTFKWVNIIRDLHREGRDVESIRKNQQVKNVLEKFNVSKRSPFVPEKAFKRFVERTITLIEEEGTCNKLF